MNIPRQTLEKALSQYREGCKYLAEAELNYPEANGLFRIPYSSYSYCEGHLNAVEMTICYNQLAYAMFTEAFRRGLVEEVGKMPLEEFNKYKLGNTFIVNMNNILFKEQINPAEFRGKIRLKEVIPKKENTLYFFKTDFDFESGKAKGEIDLALVLEPK